MLQCIFNANTRIDRPSSHLRVHHLDLGLLPLAHHHVPRDQQRRCHPHWRRYYNSHLPWWLGHRQCARQPGRILTIGTLSLCHLSSSLTPTVRLRDPLHLPDFHRLPAIPRLGCRRECSLRSRPSTVTTYHHGLIYHTPTRPWLPANNCPHRLQPHGRCHHDHHTLGHRLPRLPRLRHVRCRTHHSRHKRKWRSSTIARTQLGRRRRDIEDSGLLDLVQPEHHYCSLHQSANATFRQWKRRRRECCDWRMVDEPGR
jgi:hypothetical protein